MAVFVPMAAGAQVEAVFTLGGQFVENTFWFTYDNPPYTITELQGLRDGFYAWHLARIMPLLSQDIELHHVTATSWFSSLHFGAFTTDPPVPGGRAVESLSANVALVIPFKWALGVREKQNKNYLPGIPENVVNLNTIDATYNDEVFEAYVSLVDDARDFPPSRSWHWVVRSSFDGGVARSEQFTTRCQGVPQNTLFKLGQRRTRLP
jgi:hypothetical protein